MKFLLLRKPGTFCQHVSESSTHCREEWQTRQYKIKIGDETVTYKQISQFRIWFFPCCPSERGCCLSRSCVTGLGGGADAPAFHCYFHAILQDMPTPARALAVGPRASRAPVPAPLASRSLTLFASVALSVKAVKWDPSRWVVRRIKWPHKLLRTARYVASTGEVCPSQLLSSVSPAVAAGPQRGWLPVFTDFYLSSPSFSRLAS